MDMNVQNNYSSWLLSFRHKHLLFVIIIVIIFFNPSVVKIPRVKSSKKLKSKAGVAMHLNRPAVTPGQQKSHEIAQS